MIGIVLVSHSPKIAEGLGDLIREMAPNCPLALAAGVDDPEHPIGTDAVKIMSAVETLMSDEGVVILVDLGSAILSAQTALDLLEPEIAAKTSIAAAPLVEGAISAAIAAANGADRDSVLREAAGALKSKESELGYTAAEATQSTADNAALVEQAQRISVRVEPAQGLHARPAARIVAALRDFDAKLILEKNGRFADARSLNEIAALQVRHGEDVILHADGKDAAAALACFAELAAQHFGDKIESSASAPANPPPAADKRRICGIIERKAAIALPEIPALEGKAAQDKLAQAAAHSKAALQARQSQAEQILNAELAEIFAAHAFLLEDLVMQAQDLLEQGTHLAQAWQSSCAAAQADFQSLSDPYLRARDADIVDLAVEMAFALAGIARPHYTADSSEDAIWVLEELLVSQVLELPAHVKAVCLREGNSSSHAALCCQGRGIAYLPEWPLEIADVPSGSRYCLDI